MNYGIPASRPHSLVLMQLSEISASQCFVENKDT